MVRRSKSAGPRASSITAPGRTNNPERLITPAKMLRGSPVTSKKASQAGGTHPTWNSMPFWSRALRQQSSQMAWQSNSQPTCEPQRPASTRLEAPLPIASRSKKNSTTPHFGSSKTLSGRTRHHAQARAIIKRRDANVVQGNATRSCGRAPAAASTSPQDPAVGARQVRKTAARQPTSCFWADFDQLSRCSFCHAVGRRECRHAGQCFGLTSRTL